jgi:hypothetical protein
VSWRLGGELNFVLECSKQEEEGAPAAMPEISRFFGIVIAMYHNEHDPPHFHARYAGQKALIDIETLTVLEGRLSPRALGLVVEWAALHREELLENWRLARRQASLKRIQPLE